MQSHKHLNSTGAKIGRPSKSTVVKTRQRCLPMNHFNPKTMVTRRLPKVEPCQQSWPWKFRHVFLRNSIWTDSIPSPSADPRGVDKSSFFPMFLGSKKQQGLFEVLVILTPNSSTILGTWGTSRLSFKRKGWSSSKGEKFAGKECRCVFKPLFLVLKK